MNKQDAQFNSQPFGFLSGLNILTIGAFQCKELQGSGAPDRNTPDNEV